MGTVVGKRIRTRMLAQRLTGRSETFGDCLEQCDRNRCTVRETRYVSPCLLNKYWLSRSFPLCRSNRPDLASVVTETEYSWGKRQVRYVAARFNEGQVNGIIR